MILHVMIFSQKMPSSEHSPSDKSYFIILSLYPNTYVSVKNLSNRDSMVVNRRLGSMNHRSRVADASLRTDEVTASAKPV